MENAELIDLLRDRGYEVKSASSTIDNISADSLRDEFASKATDSGSEGPKDTAAVDAAKSEESEKPVSPPPGGAIVRSKEDIEKERLAREEEEKEKRAQRAALPQKPPLNAPPPLPKEPTVTIRTGPTAPPTPKLNKAPSLTPPTLRPPRPVIRTDQPADPAPKTEKPAEASAEAPAKPEVRPGRPGPVTTPPPLNKAPKSMAPPPVVSAPKSIKPPARVSEDKVEDKPEDSEAGEASAEASSDLRALQVKSPIVVRDFAIQIGKKPFQLISELMELGIFASMNTSVDEEVATRIARNNGFALEVRHRGEGAAVAEQPKEVKVDESALLKPRPPVICILGHVDHGKTTLLDTIRKANVVGGEAGGITQHIGAYQIEHKNQKITFIDTPGHAAFSNMRARGADTTDIAILVVAADDGFMPQTDEALTHIRKANVPVVVAINKMDAPGADIEKVRRQMQERELTPEEWGGETLSAQISALKGEGIDDLLDTLLLQVEVTEGITANPTADPEGVVIEAQKEVGRGSTASIIVQRGTLKPGMALVCGENYCRVRQLIDDKGKVIREAPPATPVKVVGWSGPPAAGDTFYTVKNERTAKREAEENELGRRQLEAAEKQEGGASIEDLFAAIAKTQKARFRVLVKADVYGTAEALATSLLNIKSEKIDLEVIDMGVGPVTRNDIEMSSAAQCAVIAFNVGLENGVTAVAKHRGVEILSHNIIYEVINQVKDAMAELLEPEVRENKIGAAQVRQVFPFAKGFVAGCMVTEGRVQRDAIARLIRNNKQVAESKVATLRRFKDDVNEVRAGYECGVQISGVNTYQEGDVIEVYEILKIKPSL